MASNQLQEKFEEANRVLSGKFSSREDMSIKIEEEIELIEEQKLETKFEERNSGGGLSRNYSNREDTLTDAKEEIQLIEEQQLQAKIKEASRVLSGKFSKREDISINIEEEMGLIEEQQLEAKSEERNSGMRYSFGEDASTHSKKEIGLKKVQQLQEKFEEANRVLSGKFSSREDISINIEEEMGLIEEQQGENLSVMARRVVIGESGETDSNTVPTSDEMGEADELVKLINGKLDKVHPSSSSEFCIYRVPQIIRKLNEEAYDPIVISIGPFHHGDTRFKSMEAFKMRFLKKVVQRSKVGLQKYVEFLKDCEANVRLCYSEPIEMGTDEFVTMLLLDGCFIIELLLCNYDSNFRDIDFSILGAVRYWADVQHDLLLLENQVPFFVLEGLSNLAMINLDSTTLLNQALTYFGEYIPQRKSHDGINSIKHFTDLILIHHRPMSPRITTQTNYQNTETITELDDVGVKFKMGSSKCLLDIIFLKGVLEIPSIMIDDDSEFLFRNLIALELCHYEHHTFITDYFIFMDSLVNTPKDVDILVQSGIVRNWLGDSKQAADLINNICTNVGVVSPSLYSYNLCKELDDYCKVPKHKWRAALKRDYFNSPWRSAATCAAIFLLGLTLIQTICSLISSITGN